MVGKTGLSRPFTLDQRDDPNDQEGVKEYLGDSGGGSGNPGESQDEGNQSDYEKGEGPA